MEEVVVQGEDTAAQRNEALVVFASARNQIALLQIHAKGRLRLRNRAGWNRLIQTGLVLMYQDDAGIWLALDPRHPARDYLNDLLMEMSGKKGLKPIVPITLPPINIKYGQALAHTHRAAFSILVELFSDRDILDTRLLHRLLPQFWPESIDAAIEHLAKSCLIEKGEDEVLRIAEDVPKNLKSFICQTAEAFSKHDPRLNQQLEFTTGRIKSFEIPDDGAPRLFATDIRLRNFMALAIYGPMLLTELRTIIGTPHSRKETGRFAQFGRGGITRMWDTKNGPAVMLDPDYPLYIPLRDLLIKMHAKYPLPVFVPRFEPPKTPPSHKWRGDRHVLFGGIIPTTILTSIGVHGWTFEALCVKVCTGHDRWNIKRSMQRLESEGVIQGDRPRSPGFNTRIVTIADDFHAKDELEALIDAYVQQWPNVEKAVWSGFNSIEPRGKAHLRNRGLWMYDKDGNKIDAVTAMLQTKKKKKMGAVMHEDPEQIRLHRMEILDQYARLTEDLGRPPQTADLLGKRDWAFYSRIIAYFGSFVEFRRVAGVPLARRPIKRSVAR